MLYADFKWMTSDKWERLCGLVLGEMGTYLPAIKTFTSKYRAYEEDFHRIRRIHCRCDMCGSSGTRTALQRTKTGEDINYTSGIARCDCDNGENWPTYPLAVDAERSKVFIRWMRPSEDVWLVVHEANTETRENIKKEREREAAIRREEKAAEAAGRLPGDEDPEEEETAVVESGGEPDTEVEIDNGIPF